MSSDHLLIIQHHSPLRTVGEAEALEILDPGELAQPRRVVSVDTRPFKEDFEGGHWRSSHAYIRQVAAQIRTVADELDTAKILYFGVAEVPHVIALGAYVGDERLVEARDYDRDRNTWRWPSTERSLSIEAHNLPREPVVQAGIAVLRVEISYPILDADIDAAVGKERLSDISVRPADRTPAPGLVRSLEDVAQIRHAVREALAALAAARPNVEAVHLFVAAPVSVCFAIGQELRLRNGKDVQTYRYRSGTGDRAHTAAILLTSGGLNEGEEPRSADEIALAQKLRSVWQAGLDDVKRHARALVADLHSAPTAWYGSLQPRALLAETAPLPGLKPIWELIKEEDRVSQHVRADDFEFSKEPREWRLSDELVLRMYDAAGGDERRLRVFARLFFWHEYVHDWQVLTKYTAEDVGSLANCLEHIDYLADAYAIFHQIDFLIREQPRGEWTERLVGDFVLQQVGAALRSFWSFEPAPPVLEWQERRLRRYLNWYWRRVQLREAPDLRAVLRLLARQPCIEISGLRYRVGRGRIFVLLNEVRAGERLHVGMVLEDGRLERRGSSTDVGIEELLLAFTQHDRDAIDRFFNALFEHVKQTGGVFPLGSSS